MRDVTGYPIHLGDHVVYSHGGRYHAFMAFYVVGFTGQMLRLSLTVDGKEYQKAWPYSVAVIEGRPER